MVVCSKLNRACLNTIKFSVLITHVARFLELSYAGGEKGEPPVVFVGKGVTFDTGGISIKPSAKMDLMRADMGGAATVTAAMTAVARLALPLNLVVLVPLTENMPGSRATRPGDVVTAMNGKTIQVNRTSIMLPLDGAFNWCTYSSFKVSGQSGAVSLSLYRLTTRTPRAA